MNPKIKQLKISNYKKKIASDYSFLKIANIYHGDEDLLNSDFSKAAVNSNTSEISVFDIYDARNNRFKDEDQERKKAMQYFQNVSIQLFEDDEGVIFKINYNGEYFRIESVFNDVISNFSKIDFSNDTIFLFDRDRTKHISLLRMEYSFEVIIYTSE